MTRGIRVKKSCEECHLQYRELYRRTIKSIGGQNIKKFLCFKCACKYGGRPVGALGHLKKCHVGADHD